MAPNRLGPRPTCPNCRASIRYLEDPESGEVTRTNGAFDAGQADQFAFDDLHESDSESEVDEEEYEEMVEAFYQELQREEEEDGEDDDDDDDEDEDEDGGGEGAAAAAAGPRPRNSRGSQAPRKQLASRAARVRAPASGGVRRGDDEDEDEHEDGEAAAAAAAGPRPRNSRGSQAPRKQLASRGVRIRGRSWQINTRWALHAGDDDTFLTEAELDARAEARQRWESQRGAESQGARPARRTTGRAPRKQLWVPPSARRPPVQMPDERQPRELARDGQPTGLRRAPLFGRTIDEGYELRYPSRRATVPAAADGELPRDCWHLGFILVRVPAI